MLLADADAEPIAHANALGFAIAKPDIDATRERGTNNRRR